MLHEHLPTFEKALRRRRARGVLFLYFHSCAPVRIGEKTDSGLSATVSGSDDYDALSSTS